VPLNAIVVLVFSEPIKPATLDASTVQLLLGSSPIAGTLAFAGTENLVVTFTPAQPLAAEAGYTVLVTQGIEDLSSDPLPADVTVAFGTGSALTGGAGIYVAGADGFGASWLVRGNRPAWSPDGQRLAFDRLGELYVVNNDGTNEVLLTQGTDPAWSPDGGSIVFAGGGGISVIDVGTQATRALILPDFDPRVPEPWGLGKPDWSPDGSRIAFEHYGDENIPVQIYVMNSDGSGPYRLSNIPGVLYAESDPSWSANGAWIAYWSYGLGIAFADPLGAVQTPVYLDFPFIAYGARPDFSPDGNTILFSSYGGDPASRGIYVIPRNGGVLRLLIPDAYHGTWSPDGTRIAFVRGAP
jgi:dipeptidyl aminopeptidase/acylaminoacyl peptidase